MVLIVCLAGRVAKSKEVMVSSALLNTSRHAKVFHRHSGSLCHSAKVARSPMHFPRDLHNLRGINDVHSAYADSRIKAQL
jgi:hypothetical protein